MIRSFLRYSFPIEISSDRGKSIGWCEYAIVQDAQKITPPPGASALDFLSLLGFTGLTAYFGLLDICNPRPGETVVVSGAAGAVGMVAAQIAKIKGSRVIGVAGGAEKCRYLKEELGLDGVVDYKSDNFKALLAKATPKYIDAYFDNGATCWKDSTYL